MVGIMEIIKIISVIILAGIILHQVNKDKKPKQHKPIPEPKPQPANPYRKLVIDTDFGSRENDNAQWMIVLRTQERNHVMTICTGCEKYEGTSKLKSLARNLGWTSPVYTGAQHEFSGDPSQATLKLIELLDSLPDGEFIEYRCGGFGYTLQELSLHRPDLRKKVKVFWVGSSNRTWSSVDKRHEKELYRSDWHQVFIDDRAFRGLNRGGNVQARDDLHKWLSNHARVGELYRSFPIEEKQYPFKCGDAVLDFYAYGEFVEIFKETRPNVFEVAEDDAEAEASIAARFNHISTVIKQNVGS